MTKICHALYKLSDGKIISGSPFPIMVKPCVQLLGPPVQVIENTRVAPYGLAVDKLKTGNVIVAGMAGIVNILEGDLQKDWFGRGGVRPSVRTCY